MEHVDRRTAWKILATLVVVVTAASAVLFGSLKEELSLWKYADEVAAAPAAFRGQRLNVGGYVRSLTADRSTLQYSFVIETRAPRASAAIPARYHGLVPDTFKTGSEVVASGKLDAQGVLEADAVMAKCPSKYTRGSAMGSFDESELSL